MEYLLVLQSKGILKNANSYILTNREKRELIDSFNSLSKMDKNIVAFMPRDTFERLYKDKLLKKIKENRDAFTGDLIQLFIDSDPTENHKYIEWLAVGYLNNGIRRLEDLRSRALPALRDFILLSNKNILNRGDPSQPWTDQYNINNFLGLSGSTKKGRQYPGLDSLIDSYQTQLNQIKGIKEQQLQVMKESELVFENELVKVYQPRSEEAACRLGAGTKWCTAARENNMFKRYSEKGDLKIIVPKSPKYTGEKYQFHHEKNEYTNELNERVEPIELFEKYKMYDELKNPNIQIIKAIKENNAERVKDLLEQGVNMEHFYDILYDTDNTDMIEKLLSYSSIRSMLNKNTILESSVETNNPEMVKLFLEYPEFKIGGENALGLAKYNAFIATGGGEENDYEIFKLLIDDDEIFNLLSAEKQKEYKKLWEERK